MAPEAQNNPVHEKKNSSFLWQHLLKGTLPLGIDYWRDDPLQLQKELHIMCAAPRTKYCIKPNLKCDSHLHVGPEVRISRTTFTVCHNSVKLCLLY